MTTIMINGDAFKMKSAELNGVTDYLSQLLTATEARYYDDANNFQRFIGMDFTYDASGNLTGGTMTKAVTVESGAERIRITGFSIDAGDFGNAVLTNDADTLWTMLLAGNDVIKGGADNDELLGNAGNDRIYGNAGNDRLWGESGADRLFGGADSDIVIGGLGNDKVDGGAGLDMLGGGPGLDTFIFADPIGPGNIDEILDFRTDQDTIQLERVEFPGVGAVGPLAAGRFFIGAAAHDASDRIIYDDGTGALLFDSDGNGANAPVVFAMMGRGLDVTAADFAII